MTAVCSERWSYEPGKRTELIEDTRRDRVGLAHAIGQARIVRDEWACLRVHRRAPRGLVRGHRRREVEAPYIPPDFGPEPEYVMGYISSDISADSAPQSVSRAAYIPRTDLIING